MRIEPTKVSPGGYEALLGIERYLEQCGLDRRLLLMVQLRASQINGCAYCIDMHWKDARATGESEQRLYGLDAWSESPYYSDKERAALAWTDAVTRLDDDISDALFQQVKAHFGDKGVADLTLAIGTINVWNRLCISLRVDPGKYQPRGKAKETPR